MITKTGAEMVKEASLGITMGLARASNLTPEERGALEKEYGLPEGADLALRNAARGFVGGSLGLLGGHAVSKLIGRKSRIPALIGAVMASKLMTDKYGVGNARKIMQLNRKQEIPQKKITSRDNKDSGRNSSRLSAARS